MSGEKQEVTMENEEEKKDEKRRRRRKEKKGKKEKEDDVPRKKPISAHSRIVAAGEIERMYHDASGLDKERDVKQCGKAGCSSPAVYYFPLADDFAEVRCCLPNAHILKGDRVGRSHALQDLLIQRAYVPKLRLAHGHRHVCCTRVAQRLP